METCLFIWVSIQIYYLEPWAKREKSLTIYGASKIFILGIVMLRLVLVLGADAELIVSADVRVDPECILDFSTGEWTSERPLLWTKDIIAL